MPSKITLPGLVVATVVTGTANGNGSKRLTCTSPLRVRAKLLVELSLKRLSWQVSSDVLATAVSGVVGGVNAAVYVTIGVITGLAVHPRDRTVAVMAGIVGLSAAGAVIATAALDAILGSPRIVWEQIPALALTSALYAVILAPLVILGVAWITKQFAPEIAPP